MLNTDEQIRSHDIIYLLVIRPATQKNEASIGRIQDGQDDNWMGHTWLLSNEQNDTQGDK